MGILKLENVSYRYKDAPKDKYVFKNINYEFEFKEEKNYFRNIFNNNNNMWIIIYNSNQRRVDLYHGFLPRGFAYNYHIGYINI